MDFLKGCQPMLTKSSDELTAIIPKVIETFIETSDDEIRRESLKLLKSSCTLDASYQFQLASHDALMDKLSQSQPISNGCMQLLANICVQNPETQEIVFHQFKAPIVSGLRDPQLSNACAMIVHQMLLSNTLEPKFVPEILENLLTHVEDGNLSDFVAFSLEFLVTEYPDILDAYQQLASKENFLYFVADFVKEHENENLEAKLFKRLVMEFKRKSDLILKPDGSGSNTSPKEVYALLELVAFCSCNPQYSNQLHADSSLFLNLGCLLLAVQKLGKQSTDSIFSPVQKLSQIAPSSSEETSIEQDISYSLKSLVVKTLGNLLYQNKKNQELVREMDILMAIMDCTNIDARNPLIKEYGILAIRNACEGNLENQKIIESLTKIGDVQSPITTELTENVIRVKPE